MIRTTLSFACFCSSSLLRAWHGGFAGSMRMSCSPCSAPFSRPRPRGLADKALAQWQQARTSRPSKRFCILLAAISASTFGWSAGAFSSIRFSPSGNKMARVADNGVVALTGLLVRTTALPILLSIYLLAGGRPMGRRALYVDSVCGGFFLESTAGSTGRAILRVCGCIFDCKHANVFVLALGVDRAFC